MSFVEKFTYASQLTAHIDAWLNSYKLFQKQYV